MTIQSKSCITSSLPQADRIVEQLREANFAPDEISVLVPEQGPGTALAPPIRADGPDSDRFGCNRESILVSVHLEGGCGMGRAEEIFGRASSEEPAPALVEDESPHSWVKPVFARIR
jgi:hypothetical protein